MLLGLALVALATGAAAQAGTGSVGLDTLTYLYAPGDGKDAFFPMVQGDYVGESRGRVFEGTISAEARVLFEPQSAVPFYEFPQAYAATSRDLGPVQASFGRRLVHWNHLDEQWELGIWQPRYRWDYLHPEQVGLTGAFIHVDRPGFQLVAFGTGISIPERGVPVEAENGQLTSPTPWFIPPANQVLLFDHVTPVRYGLSVPSIGDVVLHPGASLMARVGAASGAWASAGYAYLPMNQLLLSYDGYLSLPDQANATIYPQVAYHQLGSIEAGFEGDPVSFWISYLAEKPDRPATPASWTSQQVTPSQAVSPTLDWRFAELRGGPGRLNLSYLRQWGGNAPDAGAYATGGSVFESRYPFQNAVSLGLESPVPVVRDLLARSRVLCDVANVATIVSAELEYRVQRDWKVNLGADLLGTSDSATTDGADFIDRYRANDSVHAGVNYVF